MAIIEPRCWKCGAALEYTIDLTNSLVDIIIKTKPCNNLDCRDCSKCDEIHKKKVQKVTDERIPR